MITLDKAFYLLNSVRSVDAANDIVMFDFKSSGDIKQRFKRFIMDVKVQVDRWDIISDLMIMSPKGFEQVFAKTGLFVELNYDHTSQTTPYSIWDSNIITGENLPDEQIIVTSSEDFSDNFDDYRYVAAGIYDPKLMERYDNLKVFW